MMIIISKGQKCSALFCLNNASVACSTQVLRHFIVNIIIIIFSFTRGFVDSSEKDGMRWMDLLPKALTIKGRRVELG